MTSADAVCWWSTCYKSCTTCKAYLKTMGVHSALGGHAGPTLLRTDLSLRPARSKAAWTRVCVDLYKAIDLTREANSRWRSRWVKTIGTPRTAHFTLLRYHWEVLTQPVTRLTPKRSHLGATLLLPSLFGFSSRAGVDQKTCSSRDF